MGQAVATWASGNWSVSPGKENEFIDRWRDWLEWSRDNITGFRSATLIRDAQNDNHFHLVLGLGRRRFPRALEDQ
jgi:heme-degrading monooxygenase HmoA